MANGKPEMRDAHDKETYDVLCRLTAGGPITRPSYWGSPALDEELYEV
jgi:hypothetical protein